MNWDLLLGVLSGTIMYGVPLLYTTLGEVIGQRAGMVNLGFVILGLWEDVSADPGAEPGSWEHFKSIAPPWLTIWAGYWPHVFR